MPKPSEFDGQPNINGIMSDVDPDGRPGHELSAHEKMRLMYRAGQDPGQPDRDAKPDPIYFEGNEPLPLGLRKPKYADQRAGGFVEDER